MMRDLLAVFGVVVLAVCLGVTAAYLSVDFSPPGLDLLRPMKPEMAARKEDQERQNSIRADASGCKYCVTVASLAQRFARHARNARQQADALRRTISVERKEAVRQDELLRAERSADSAEAAAAALTSWASRCRSEDFCRPAAKPVAQASCSGTQAASVSAAYDLAASLKRAAAACSSASCPQIDCKATTSLRSEVLAVERSLTSLAGGRNLMPKAMTIGNLPVGPATFSAEIKRVGDDANYISRMLPVLLEAASSQSQRGHLPRLAAGLVDDRAVNAAQLATVMEHAADIAGNARNDMRSEAAWRLKALATSLGQLGKETETKDMAAINWRAAADYLGAALLDVARLQAMVSRTAGGNAAGTPCDATAPEAAQQLRQAIAMLDLCRMRSACTSRGGSAALKAGDLEGGVERSQQLLASLASQEVSVPALVEVAAGTTPRPIDVVRNQYGVCTKAAELREASSMAPAAAAAVAEGVAPAVQPAVNPVAPQDLVTGAATAAVEVSAPTAESTPTLVEAAAPAGAENAVDDSLEASAPAPAGDTPMFSGSLLTPGGSAALASAPDQTEGRGNR
ncbi:MAG: hypothetical protein ACK55V_01900 [Alphaproteobacteria bacterium]